MRYINLDGKLQDATTAFLPHDNRAFRYGYGLFETMLFKDGHIELKELHFQRLLSGMQQLYFELPKLMTTEWLEAEIIKTVKKNALEKLCRVRLQVFAGPGGLYDAADQRPHFVVECFLLQEDVLALNENGLTVCIATGLQKANDNLANLKSTNALIYALAAQQARQQKCNDALICNTHGNIIESTIANIFWVKDNVIYTPRLSEGCIAGVMRHHLINTLAAKNTTVVETMLSPEILLSADEVFLTNAVRRIKWVGSIEHVNYAKAVISSIVAVFPNI